MTALLVLGAVSVLVYIGLWVYVDVYDIDTSINTGDPEVNLALLLCIAALTVSFIGVAITLLFRLVVGFVQRRRTSLSVANGKIGRKHPRSRHVPRCSVR